MSDRTRRRSRRRRAVPTADADRTAHHFWRLIAIWVVLSAILDPLFYFLVGPHIPPGTMTNVAAGAQFDFNVLFVIALPVLLAVWIYMVYAFVIVAGVPGRPRAGRRAQRPGPPRRPGGLDPHHHASSCCSCSSSAPTSSCNPAGPGAARARARSGPPPRNTILPIQVIGQQWKFTYRYPTFGGFETDQLVHPRRHHHRLPRDVPRRHPQLLGLPARASRPTPTRLQQRRLHHHPPARARSPCGATSSAASGTAPCSTPARRDEGSTSSSWARPPSARLRKNTKLLPPFAWTYVPDANGADGGYYPDNVDPYSKVEHYGATAAKADVDRGDDRPSTRRPAESRVHRVAMTTARSRRRPAGPASRRCRPAPGWFSQHICGRSSAASSATCSATGSATSWPAATPTSQASGQNDVAIVLGAVLRRARLAARHRGPQLPAGQDGRAASSPPARPSRRAGPGTSASPPTTRWSGCSTSSAS